MYMGTHRCAYTPINGNTYHGSLIWDDTVIDTSAPSRSPEVLLTLHGPPPPAGVCFGLHGLPGTTLVLWEQLRLHHILTYLGGDLSSWLKRGAWEGSSPAERGWQPLRCTLLYRAPLWGLGGGVGFRLTLHPCLAVVEPCCLLDFLDLLHLAAFSSSLTYKSTFQHFWGPNWKQTFPPPHQKCSEVEAYLYNWYKH